MVASFLWVRIPNPSLQIGNELASYSGLEVLDNAGFNHRPVVLPVPAAFRGAFEMGLEMVRRIIGPPDALLMLAMRQHALERSLF